MITGQWTQLLLQCVTQLNCVNCCSSARANYLNTCGPIIGLQEA